MTLEGIAAIAVALFALAGYIYTLGQNNYRFTESGRTSAAEDARIRADMKLMEERICQQIDIRYQALLKDINGIGASSRSLRALANERYHNSSLVHMVNAGQIGIAEAAGQAKGKHSSNLLGIAGLLREEIHD